MERQKTIRKAVSYKGIGLHTGKEVTISLEPAPVDQRIVFVREDLPGSPRIEAKVNRVISDKRGTSLGQEEAKVRTVEHILAALAGLKVDNVTIRMDREEIPAADGSALPFVKLIEKAEVMEQEIPRDTLRIEEPFWIEEEGRHLAVIPDDELRITYTVDFPYSWLKSQFAEFVINKETFVQEIAPSRTFGFMEEVEELKKRGLIKGGSLENAVVITKSGVINEEGLRFPNEPVRHKILDLIGDLYLVGSPIQAHILAIKSGHSFNLKLIRRLAELRGEREKRTEIPLDIRTIERILPHRYPFLLVDRILELGEKEIVGIKNVTVNEPFFSGHFPGHPIVPAALIIEAMAQVAGVYLLGKSENQGKLAYFAGIDKARFRRPVVPGDQLVTRVKILSLRKAMGKVEAMSTVEGKVVAEAQFLFSLVKR